jgi:Flp pilus assembly protein TadD
MKRVRVAAAILSLVGLVIAAAPGTAGAQAPVYAETLADTLARHVRTLASSPRDFGALIGAGKAALQMGDAQAAAGFYGRAEEVSPRSPLPQIGMGAALVASGDAQAALLSFARAQQLGGTVASFGADRGLAFDLLGQQTAAQSDYRAALNGPDSDEARRRLALSLAISGDKQGALAMLAPLLARRDRAATRCRSLVLALAGDVAGAKAALDSMIPGASRPMEPFFHRLPALSGPQKAAAVHLGVFPDSGSPAYASAGQPSGPSLGQPSADDRLASIEQLLRAPAPQPVYAPPVQRAAPPVQVAPVARAVAAAASSKVWLQLASGSNVAAMPDQFRRIKRSTRDLLDGIDAHVAEEPNRVRLLIGPFKDKSDASIFAEDLGALNVEAFSWTNRPGQPVRKLPLE